MIASCWGARKCCWLSVRNRLTVRTKWSDTSHSRNEPCQRLVGVVIATVLAQAASKEAPKPIVIPIQAVKISDDDGRRPAAVSPAQVKHWIDYANAVYAGCGIRFRYAISDGFAERKSTLLNNIDGTSDSDWLQSKRLGNEVAAKYPRRLTVLFRHGAGPNPSGKGFGWFDYDFIVMPGFDGATACGRQNIGMFAHEAGHYLGLLHPFRREFETVAEADAWLKDHKGEVSSFDGDGLSDTPPDPFIKALQCGSDESVVLQGRKIAIDRTNIMGYWPHHRKTISPQQAEIARWFARRRQQSRMLLQSIPAVKSPLEAEALEISERRGVRTSTRNMDNFGAGNWSGSTQLSVIGEAGNGLTINLPVEKTGRYQLSIYLTMGPDFGQIQPQLDGELLGSPIDLYAPRVISSGRVILATQTFQAGRHAIGIDITGKSEASTGTAVGIDCFELAAAEEDKSKSSKAKSSKAR